MPGWTDRVTRVECGWGGCEIALGCRDASMWGSGGAPTATILPLPQSGTLAQGVSRCPVRGGALGQWSAGSALPSNERPRPLPSAPMLRGRTATPPLEAKIFWGKPPASEAWARAHQQGPREGGLPLARGSCPSDSVHRARSKCTKAVCSSLCPARKPGPSQESTHLLWGLQLGPVLETMTSLPRTGLI